MTRDSSGCRQALLGIHTHMSPREGQTYMHSHLPNADMVFLNNHSLNIIYLFAILDCKTEVRAMI